MSDALTLALETLNGTLSRVECLLGTIIEQRAHPAPGPSALQQIEDIVCPPQGVDHTPSEARPAPAPAAPIKRKKRNLAQPEEPAPKADVPPPAEVDENPIPAPAPVEDKPVGTEPPITLAEVRAIAKQELLIKLGWSVSDFREWLEKNYQAKGLDQISDAATLGAVRDHIYALRDKGPQ